MVLDKADDALLLCCCHEFAVMMEELDSGLRYKNMKTALNRIECNGIVGTLQSTVQCKARPRTPETTHYQV